MILLRNVGWNVFLKKNELQTTSLQDVVATLRSWLEPALKQATFYKSELQFKQNLMM